jgi:hypothetical protein
MRSEKGILPLLIAHCSLLCGMAYSTEPHSGEGSPLDAAVTIALAWSFYTVKTPIYKISMDAVAPPNGGAVNPSYRQTANVPKVRRDVC